MKKVLFDQTINGCACVQRKQSVDYEDIYTVKVGLHCCGYCEIVVLPYFNMNIYTLNI